MNRLIFATHNPHKVAEMQSAIGRQFELISLDQAGIKTVIPEPHDTLEDNASEKSKKINELTGLDCFAEDTGLETIALHGEPGVSSARYAGDERDFEKNIDLLLSRLSSFSDRKARFRTVISLIFHGKEYFFEGICEGEILFERKGLQGFGYDSVFLPQGSGKSFAEMSLVEKNKYSHRKKAADKLTAFLSLHATQ